MKLEDFLRQNIEHIDRPISGEGPFARFFDGIIKFPLLTMKIFFVGKFPGIIKGIFFFLRFSKDNRYRKKIIKKYKKLHHGDIRFSFKQYKKAEEALRVFTPLLPKNAYKKYGEDIVDILVLANGVYMYEGKLKRLVSIKSIEEDREAGPDDD